MRPEHFLPVWKCLECIFSVHPQVFRANEAEESLTCPTFYSVTILIPLHYQVFRSVSRLARVAGTSYKHSLANYSAQCLACYGIISYVSDLTGWTNMVGVSFISKSSLTSTAIKCTAFWAPRIKSFKIAVIGPKIKGASIIRTRPGRSLSIAGRTSWGFLLWCRSNFVNDILQ